MSAEDLIEALQHGLADLVLVLDGTGVVIWAGGDLAATIGGTPSALRARRVADLFDGSAEMRNWLGPIGVARGEPSSVRQGRLRCVDGSLRDCEIRMRFVNAEARVATVRLLSHHARESQGGKPRLLEQRTIHDLNNYLGVVLGFADILLATERDDRGGRADLLEIRAAALAALERLRSG